MWMKANEGLGWESMPLFLYSLKNATGLQPDKKDQSQGSDYMQHQKDNSQQRTSNDNNGNSGGGQEGVEEHIRIANWSSKRVGKNEFNNEFLEGLIKSFTQGSKDH